MVATDAEHVRKHVRVYLAVFAALAVLTVVTVLASYLKVSPGMAVVIALMIASVKASLVAGFFMHLVSERAAVYGLLILTLLFLIVMLVIPYWTDSELVVSSHVS